jgi:hypothetical protein
MRKYEKRQLNEKDQRARKGQFSKKPENRHAKKIKRDDGRSETPAKKRWHRGTDDDQDESVNCEWPDDDEQDEDEEEDDDDGQDDDEGEDDLDDADDEEVEDEEEDEEGDDSRNRRQPKDDFVNSKLSRCFDDKRRGTFVPDWAQAVARNGNEMLILGQLNYYFGIGSSGKLRSRQLLRHRGCKYFWVAKSCKMLAKETGLTPRQVRHAVETLVQRKLIIKQKHKFYGNVMHYLRINRLEVESAWMEARDGIQEAEDVGV